MRLKHTIKVTSKEKMTTLRLSEATKKELESFGRAGETHEEMLLDVLNLLKNMVKDSETKIIQKNNVIGTKYGRISKTFDIEIDKKKYSVVCTYNDISVIVMLRNNRSLSSQLSPEWEVNLEIVNFKAEVADWQNPNILYNKDKKTWLLLYFIAFKEVIEEMCNIKINEFSTVENYLNYDIWKQAYLKYKLSLESLSKDIEKRLR